MLLGNEVLLRDHLREIQGKRLGLVANTASVTGGRMPVHLVLHRHPKLALVSLFSPEHGFEAVVQDAVPVPDSRDKATGLPVYSLYGKSEGPSPAQLKKLDLLLLDLQDVGVRFYTYLSTLFHCLRACGKAKVPMMVLDRPNPLTGTRVEGPMLDPRYSSFVGLVKVPLRHGMTLGELARYLNQVYTLKAELKVIPMKGWSREMWFDQTGLAWVPPSPNLPSFSSALVYPGTCLIEGTNLSEGRGTPLPFQQVGAPWVDPGLLVSRLNALKLPGAHFAPVAFIPKADKHHGRACYGVTLSVTHRRAFNPLLTGLYLIQAVRATEPGKFAWHKQGSRHFIDLLLGTDVVRKGLEAGKMVQGLMNGFAPQVREFMGRRKKFLLYG
jgi:uncharacterized protein YbbC (DUF1343 family)